MNRKLKMLSFAVIAALALSAVGASGASANNTRHFTSEIANTKLDAEATSAQVFEVTGGALTTECKKVSVTATVPAATVTQITAVPAYSECKQKGEERVIHVTMTSCAYVFTATRTTPNGIEDSHSEAHIECTTPGDHIHVKVTTIIGQLNCLTVPAQTPTSKGVVYETGGLAGKTHDIVINATVEGITYTEQGACGGSTGNDGRYTGKVTVKGTDAGGNQVGITWT